MTTTTFSPTSIPGVTEQIVAAINEPAFWNRIATLPMIDQQHAVIARLNIELRKRDAKVAQTKARIAESEALSAVHLGIPEYVLKDAASRGI